MGEIKGKGGAGRGQGRKKRTVEPVVAIDGRSRSGQQHAQELIDALNAIDPQLYADMQLVVSEEPIEIDSKSPPEIRKQRAQLEAVRVATLKRKQKAYDKFRELSFEVQGWAPLWFERGTALATRTHLHDKAGGKAIQTVNYVHDKPIEHNVTLNLSERFRIAMEKATKRVSDLR